jgi:hypothetical protein
MINMLAKVGAHWPIAIVAVGVLATAVWIGTLIWFFIYLLHWRFF